MALTIQPSFAAGELDPALHERTNLQKYQSALATAKNVVVGKTGRLVSRPSRKHLVATKLANRKVIIHAMPQTGLFLEWGHLYVRVYKFDGTLLYDLAHASTESDLDLIQFVDIDATTVAILRFGTDVRILRVSIASSAFLTTYFDLHLQPEIELAPALGGTGYDVRYVATSVRSGVESQPGGFPDFTFPKLPIAASETNVLQIFSNLTTPEDSLIDEIKLYRRPANGGAYGFIGSTTKVTSGTGATRKYGFTDFGQDADYTHTPPTLNSDIKVDALSGPAALKSRTGTIYQQRFLLSYLDKIETSRTGFKGNFYRDYPIAADSSLSMKSGGQGFPEILWMMDNDGLIVFTTEGIYLHLAELSPTNLALSKKGNWVIDDKVPPLAIPGAVLFIDATTNTLRQLAFSSENGSYIGEELSIFSDHLFLNKKVVSMAYQNGPLPLLWVVFSDGTFASFTYEREQQMRAWTRHESSVKVEYVASASLTKTSSVNTTGLASQIIFVVNDSGTRYLELGVPRYPDVADVISNPETDKANTSVSLDSMVSWSYLVNNTLIDDNITVTPVTPGDWEGVLTIAVVNDGIFPSSGPGWPGGLVGNTLRHFNPVDGSAVDLEVLTRPNNNTITVQPSAEFPSAYATNPRLYATSTTITGLSHLNGESVSIVADGYIAASPNNDIEDYPTVTVSGGSVTLPNGYRGAIVHVGRPFTADVETLDLDTVEQRPILLESKTVNKLYLKTFKSGSLYIGPKFPKDGKVLGNDKDGTAMTEVDSIHVDYENDDDVIANRFDAPTTKRSEVILPGDWKSQGRVCIRQVDPVQFEILSIAPDVEDLRR